MASRIKIVEHKGQKVLLLDASNLKPEEIVAMFPEYQQIGVANKIRLYALDVTNTRSNDDIRKGSKESIDFIQSRLGTVYIALIGISGIQKVIASAINRDTYFASSLEDACETLVKKISK